MHANAKLQIFAPRAYEHVSEYVPIPDRQRFGTTSGLHTLFYENPGQTSTLTHFYVYDSG